MATKQQKEKRKFTSAKQTASKHDSGFSSTSVKIPDGVKLFKLKEGTMLIDIIPFKAGAGNPHADEGEYHYERTFHIHRNVGPNSDSYVCLAKTANKPCPVCEYRKKLSSDPDADEKTIKEMAPKERQIFNVIDRKDPESGIQLLEISYHLFGKLLNERIAADEEDEGWDRFFHPTEGFTLRLTVKEDSMGENKFLRVAAIDLRPRKEQYAETIVDDAHCLDDLIKLLPYEKLKSILLQTNEEGDDDDDEKPKGKKSDSDKKSAKADDDDADDDDDDADDDDEPKGKKKSSKSDDDDDEKPKGKKSKPAADDDDEPKKSSKKAAASDDDDDDDEPKKPAKKSSKPADDDDDDDDDDSDDDDDEPKKPAKKLSKPADDDDDDDEPKSKKSKAAASDDDDDDEPAKKPKGKSKSDDDDDWDDDDDKPKGKSKKSAKADDDDDE